jgi:hypothetical protein
MVFHNDGSEGAHRRRRWLPWIIGLGLAAAVALAMVLVPDSGPSRPADTNVGPSTKTLPTTQEPPSNAPDHAVANARDYSLHGHCFGWHSIQRAAAP